MAANAVDVGECCTGVVGQRIVESGRGAAGIANGTLGGGERVEDGVGSVGLAELKHRGNTISRRVA